MRNDHKLSSDAYSELEVCQNVFATGAAETYIILTTSSVVPGCESIALLVPSLSIFTYSAPRPHA